LLGPEQLWSNTRWTVHLRHKHQHTRQFVPIFELLPQRTAGESLFKKIVSVRGTMFKPILLFKSDTWNVFRKGLQKLSKFATQQTERLRGRPGALRDFASVLIAGNILGAAGLRAGVECSDTTPMDVCPLRTQYA
jgi:hypothetical protein